MACKKCRFDQSAGESNSSDYEDIFNVQPFRSIQFFPNNLAP